MSVSFSTTWHRWLMATRDVHRRYFNAMGDSDDPFAHNERASMGTLIAGAERAGMVTLSEYPTNKNASSGTARHRCDLYLYDEKSGDEWGFEFKQSWYGVKDTLNKLEEARRDALELSRDDCGTRAFGTVASLYSYDLDERGEIITELYRELNNRGVDLFEIGEEYNSGVAVVLLGIC